MIQCTVERIYNNNNNNNNCQRLRNGRKPIRTIHLSATILHTPISYDWVMLAIVLEGEVCDNDIINLNSGDNIDNIESNNNDADVNNGCDRNRNNNNMYYPYEV